MGTIVPVVSAADLLRTAQKAENQRFRVQTTLHLEFPIMIQEQNAQVAQLIRASIPRLVHAEQLERAKAPLSLAKFLVAAPARLAQAEDEDMFETTLPSPPLFAPQDGTMMPSPRTRLLRSVPIRGPSSSTSSSSVESTYVTSVPTPGQPQVSLSTSTSSAASTYATPDASLNASPRVPSLRAGNLLLPALDDFKALSSTHIAFEAFSPPSAKRRPGRSQIMLQRPPSSQSGARTPERIPQNAPSPVPSPSLIRAPASAPAPSAALKMQSPTPEPPAAMPNLLSRPNGAALTSDHWSPSGRATSGRSTKTSSANAKDLQAAITRELQQATERVSGGLGEVNVPPATADVVSQKSQKEAADLVCTVRAAIAYLLRRDTAALLLQAAWHSCARRTVHETWRRILKAGHERDGATLSAEMAWGSLGWLLNNDPRSDSDRLALEHAHTARQGAARALIEQRVVILNALVIPAPEQPKSLAGVLAQLQQGGAKTKVWIDQLLRETTRRLLGRRVCTSDLEEQIDPSQPRQAEVWALAARQLVQHMTVSLSSGGSQSGGTVLSMAVPALAACKGGCTRRWWGRCLRRR